MPEGPTRRRVVIIDDSPLTATGTEVLLRPDPRVEVVANLTHDDALVSPPDWHAVDVVLLDVTDSTQADKFPGLAVLTAIRAAAQAVKPCVIVITDRFAHAGLRERLRAAQADFCFLREDVRTKVDLAELVLHPDRWRRTPPPPQSDPPANLGLQGSSDINAVVEYMERHGLAAAWRAEGRVRTRRNNEHRRELMRLGNLRVVDATGSGQRAAGAPSIPQLLRIWDWATEPGPPD